MQLFWPERISSGSEEGEEGAEEDEAAARATQTCAIRKTISRLALGVGIVRPRQQTKASPYP